MAKRRVWAFAFWGGGILLIASTALFVYPTVARLLGPRQDCPVLVLSTAHVQFGRLKIGEKVEATITIENAGGRTLHLEDPTASCGCQTPKLSKKVVVPGERATLVLNQVATPQIGPFRHVVFLRSDDPDKPELMIYLDGVVSKGVVVRPEPIVFDALRPREARTRYVEIASDEGKPFRIRFLNGFGPVQVRGTLDFPAVVHKVEVTATGGDDLGDFQGTLIADLDIPGQPPLMIPVRGTVRGTFRIVPDSLNLGVLPSQSRVERKILVSGDSKQKLRIGKVEGLPPAWTLEHSASAEGSVSQLLVLKIKLPDLRGPMQASLRIEVISEQGRAQSIDLPINVVLSEKVRSN